MAVTSPFPYAFKEPDYENGTCVFKLWFGTRYFIYKGLRLRQVVENLSNQIHREKSNPKENSILWNVVAYIKTARVTMMTVEVIKFSDLHTDILMTEYEALQAAKKDKNCLNTSFVNYEHFPHWMKQTAINDFRAAIHGIKMPDKHKNLQKFLLSNITGKNKDEVVSKIFDYVTTRFR